MTVNQSPRMTVDYQEIPNSFYRNPNAFRMMLDSMPQTWIRTFFRHAYEEASGGK